MHIMSEERLRRRKFTVDSVPRRSLGVKKRPTDDVVDKKRPSARSRCHRVKYGRGEGTDSDVSITGSFFFRFCQMGLNYDIPVGHCDIFFFLFTSIWVRHRNSVGTHGEFDG